MSVPIFLLWLVSIPLIVQAGSAPPRGFLLNCGSDNELQEGGLKYITDDGFITVGNKTTLKQPGLHMVLSTLRYFPDNAAHKYCYVFPVIKGGKFLVKTTYYYGGYDGEKEPPVFDQFIDGTKWSMVNTTEDYANGLSSFYEIIVTAHGKTLSVCLARNQHTMSRIASDVKPKSLVFETGFPDDQFNRFWTPFKDSNPVVTSRSNITASEFWNIPPANALSAAITTSRGKKLTVQWPPFLLPKTNYYIALYFQDNRNPSPYSWRVFSVAVNGMDFYTDINVTTKGVSVYTAHWPLAGQTEIVLTPHSDSPVGPLINAGEVFQIFPLGKRTLTRDGSTLERRFCRSSGESHHPVYFQALQRYLIAIEDLARGFDNPPGDWHGDPCLPEKHSWTGVTCSIGAKYARIVSLNLTNVGLIGELAESVDHLTALTSLTLEGNKLSGSIPKMSSLKSLEILITPGNHLATAH
ncbi:hypothetical protein HYC85_007549 [Camellia sinensis]|uniref:Malectin-like domain-containing protein n=1 Tax=Camellia sinensis TaxID=4442 RepID=A0A7J7HP87_CAMSI|nr:hypothetical protein HYC85_007549 [Camellia sinensis]